MELYVHVPLRKIKSTKPINKIELTHIDQHLSSEQKKRVAKFFREEATKRTRYDVEHTWTMPETVLAIEKTDVIRIKPETKEDEEEEPAQSSPSTIVTDNDVLEQGEADTLEIATSPLPESDSKNERSSHGNDSPETEFHCCADSVGEESRFL